MAWRVIARNVLQFSSCTQTTLPVGPTVGTAFRYGSCCFHRRSGQGVGHTSRWTKVVKPTADFSSSAQFQPKAAGLPQMTSVSETEAVLTVTWSDDNVTQFPFIWLQDNCMCSQCYHPEGKGRLITMRDLDMDLRPETTQITDGGDVMHISWTNGHQSEFTAPWLRSRAFTREARKSRQNCYRSNKCLWDSEVQPNLPKAQFNDIMTSDKALYHWLNDLDVHGIVIIENAPRKVGQIKAISDRIAFQKLTQYGLTFTVQSKGEPSNVAYTSLTLPLHTDLPYYHYCPGTQFLHCIIQYEGDGGTSQLVDGFNIARQLKRVDPDSYHMLTNTAVGYFDEGFDFTTYDKKYKGPVIVENRDGEIVQIKINNMQRDSMIDTESVEDVIALYKALRLFEELCYHPSNLVQIKLQPGDIATMDNHRVLHGRQGFTPSPAANRHFQGGYVDWDEIISTLRVLRSKLGIQATTEK